MAISDPTIIGQPPTQGQVTGPIAKLFTNQYKTFAFTYPRNLGGDPSRRHVIEFVTRVADPSFSPTGVSLKAGIDIAEGIGRTALQATQEALTGNTGAALTTLGNALTGAAQENSSTSQLFRALSAADVKRKDGTTIRLYVPDTVNVQYSAAYDDVSLASALGKPYFIAQAGVSLFDKYKNAQGTGIDMEKVVNAVGDDPYVRTLIGNFLGEGVGQLLTAAVGQALNPQLQVIFSGVGFRQFQFDFTLTPYSAEEAQAIKNIVFHFKLAAAPQVQPASIFGQGLFYKVPDRFKIRFLYNGSENLNVHRIAECVLENVAVDYAPIGWATFGDGNPVQTKLTLQFKEVEIIDKTRIIEGY